MNQTSKIGTFQTADGVSLKTRTWSASQRRAVLVLHHGYGEHSGRYEAFGETLANAGVEVRAIDCRGHGLSPGQRGRVSDFETLVDDLGAFVERTQLRYTVPVFLLGHSMGGVVAGLWAARPQADLEGLILSSPAFLTPDSRSRTLVFLARCVARVLPGLPTKRIGAGRLSHDESVARDYRSDPLNYVGRIRVRTATQILLSGLAAMRQSESVVLPLYLFHGSQDTIALPEGSRRFFGGTRSGDKTFREHKGLFHETLNERNRDSVIAELIAWLDKRIVESPARVST